MSMKTNSFEKVKKKKIGTCNMYCTYNSKLFDQCELFELSVFIN